MKSQISLLAARTLIKTDYITSNPHATEEEIKLYVEEQLQLGCFELDNLDIVISKEIDGWYLEELETDPMDEKMAVFWNHRSQSLNQRWQQNIEKITQAARMVV